MTPDERQMLVDLFERIRATASSPRDAQAEDLINGAVRAAPFAPYALAQTVLVQNQALERAAQRITELEAAARQPEPEQPTSFLGGLGKTLFGGGSSAPQAQPHSSYDASAYQRSAQPQPGPAYAPPPNYSAPPQNGPWGAPASSSGGGSFLGNAMSTAAGVAGGIALGNVIGGLFGGHGGGLFGGGGGFLGGGPQSVTNIFEPGRAGDGANLREMDALQDQQQDALDDADAQQDAYQDAGWDDSGGGGDGGGSDV